MVSIPLEGLWMVSDRIVDFQFFIKFHRSSPAIIFIFWTMMKHVSYPSKMLLIKSRFIRTSSRWSILLWRNCGWFLIGFVNFGFFVIFHRSGPAIIFSFWTITEHVRKNVPNQAKIYQDFIMTVSFTLEGLWMVSDRIVDFRLSSNFTGPDLQ